MLVFAKKAKEKGTMYLVRAGCMDAAGGYAAAPPSCGLGVVFSGRNSENSSKRSG
jgi:hypothetical protein